MSQFSPAPRRGIQPRADRALARRVGDVRGDVVVGAARIEGASALTEFSLLEAGRLSLQEARLCLFAPTGHLRYAALCDAFATKASNEILSLGSRRGLLG